MMFASHPRGPRTAVRCAHRTVRRVSARTGATVLEFALTVPVFFAVLLGIIEVGRGLMLMHQLSNAARIGARLATIPGTSTDEVKTIVGDNLKRQGITPATITTKVSGTDVEAATVAQGTNLTVEVTVPIATFTWVPGGTHLKGNLTGRHSLRRE